MQPANVLREAARLIETGGFSQGCHARNFFGEEIELFLPGSSENGRAGLNPSAVSFSLYGAVAAVLSKGHSNPSAIWPLLAAEAAKLVGDIPGGANHLHPLILFSEHMDTDQTKAVTFLLTLASTLEQTKGVSNG